MKTPSLLALSLAALLLAACNKTNKDESLTARVVEYGTHKPIPNVGVLVHYRVPGDGLSGGRDVPYDSVVSNANGEVFLDGSEHSPGELKIYTRDTNYFDDWGGGSSYSVTELFKRNPVMELKPISWLNVRIYNKHKIYDYFACAQFPFGFQQYYGNNIDDTVLYTLPGNDLEVFSIYKGSGGAQSQLFHDSVYVNGHDTTYFELIY